MLEIVLAMVTLSNTAPDSVATPSAAISSRLPGAASATGLQGQGLDTSAGFGSVTVNVGCSYGAPRLGPAYINDIAGLTRTLSTPACADAAPMTFGNPLTGPLGFVPFYRFSQSPLTIAQPSAQLDLPMRDVDTASTFTLPARSSVRILDHFKLPAEFRGGVGNATISTDSPTRAIAPRRASAKPH